MQISRIFQFDASHMLPGHPGKCKNLHGHTYTLEVGVTDGIVPETGMVMDYGDLKKQVMKVLDKYDHAYMYNANTTDLLEDSIAKLLSDNNRAIKAINGRTTTENIARQLFHELGALGLPISKIKLSETPTTFVEV